MPSINILGRKNLDEEELEIVDSITNIFIEKFERHGEDTKIEIRIKPKDKHRYRFNATALMENKKAFSQQDDYDLKKTLRKLFQDLHNQFHNE